MIAFTTFHLHYTLIPVEECNTRDYIATPVLQKLNATKDSIHICLCLNLAVLLVAVVFVAICGYSAAVLFYGCSWLSLFVAVLALAICCCSGRDCL